MESQRKDKLMSFRLCESHYDYLNSHAEERKITVSEFLRIIIEKDLGSSGHSKTSLGEVVSYLRNLTPLQRSEILDKVEGSERRKINSYIVQLLEDYPEIKKRDLCSKVSDKFNIPINFDFKRKIYLKMKSFKRKKRDLEEFEADEIASL